MNALAHYHLLSARQPSTSAENATQHRAEAKTILERLEVIDEDRKERYRELGEFNEAQLFGTQYSADDSESILTNKLGYHNAMLDMYKLPPSHRPLILGHLLLE